VAAIILAIIAFLCSVTYVFPIIAGAVSVIIVLLTLCLRLPKPVFYLAIVGTVVASIGNFVSATQNTDEPAVRTFAIIAGILWLIDAVLIYKIPVGDAASSSSSENEMTPPTQPDFDTSNEPV
jgi:uncharacterized membrane protein